MKIALGTTSKQKIQYLEEVLKELEISAILVPNKVSSGISNQPTTSEETKRGSINRAKNAISKSKDCDFALGIEVGYQPGINGDYEMFCWATIIDKNGEQISAQSHKLLLPQFHQQILKSNKYLSDFVQQYLEENSNPISQHIGKIIRDRKPFIQTSVKLVLLNYLIK